ncbi:hypothetical protein SAMN04515674_107215 [Pseudarcicella hirudinis]|uniref:DUF2029 domain-containing protein n=2 Tax=Pseudarcicella hirudinis TaxID=1079859 RepID=A0A1I5UJC6_9BACT|nr:hypothetical protein [Pseudarcicella hirudinis]SFP95279.1 hypothetical protein SAMN04515674_107215 [Pseudarcicella hirudinis]
MSVLFVKITLSLILLALTGLVIKYQNSINTLTEGKEVQYFLSASLVLRIIPFIIIFIFLNVSPHSDVIMFMNWAVSAKSGHLVYRDFDSPYAPLFSYITALPLWLWDSDKAIIALMIVVELVVLWCTCLFYRSTVKFHVVLIYLLLPISFVLTVLGGQEDIWMWGIALLALWVNRKYKNDFILGIALAMGLVFTKVLFVLVIPAVFIFVKDRVKLVAGLLTIGIPVLGILIWKSGFAFLLPIQQANDPRTPNFWTILNPFFSSIVHLGSKPLNWIGLISIPISTCLVALKFRDKIDFQDFFPRLWVFTYAWMMISQQSSLANYAFIYAITLVYTANLFNDKKSIIIFFIFNFAIIVQPAIWWNIGMPLFSHPSDLASTLPFFEYILEIVIVSCLVYYLRKMVKSPVLS